MKMTDDVIVTQHPRDLNKRTGIIITEDKSNMFAAVLVLVLSVSQFSHASMLRNK